MKKNPYSELLGIMNGVGRNNQKIFTYITFGSFQNDALVSHLDVGRWLQDGPDLDNRAPVSYTHLDVYKRQL